MDVLVLEVLLWQLIFCHYLLVRVSFLIISHFIKKQKSPYLYYSVVTSKFNLCNFLFFKSQSPFNLLITFSKDLELYVVYNQINSPKFVFKLGFILKGGEYFYITYKICQKIIFIFTCRISVKQNTMIRIRKSCTNESE